MGNGNMYNVVLGGKDMDVEKVVNGGMKELSRVVAEISKNPNIKIVDIPWISVFRYVFPIFGESVLIVYTTYSPSFRYAERFSEGRVFIAGGKVSFSDTGWPSD